MGQAIPVRTDYTVGEVRQFAKRAKDVAQARRLLAIAAVLDGASREDAAKIGGVDRQALPARGIRVNRQGPGGPASPRKGRAASSISLRLAGRPSSTIRTGPFSLGS